MENDRIYHLHYVFRNVVPPGVHESLIQESVTVQPSSGESVLGRATKELSEHHEKYLPQGVGYQSAPAESHFHFTLFKPGVDPSTFRGHGDEVFLPYSFRPDPLTDDRGSEFSILCFSPFPYESHPAATFDDIEVAVAAGYVHAEPNHIVIRYVEGRGGDSQAFDFVSWLLDQGVDLGVGIVASYVGHRFVDPLCRKVRNGRIDRQARKVAWEWQQRNLLYPAQLRRWVESKDSWDPHEISTRLCISLLTARQLLKALGYEENIFGLWSPGTSKKARRRHDSWLINEFRSAIDPQES